MELIKIRVENGQQLVSARELYEFLGTTERFSSWFERYCKYGFEENIDFIKSTKNTFVNNGAKRELKDFMITIEMAVYICRIIKFNPKTIEALKQLRKKEMASIEVKHQKRLECQFGDMLEKITGFEWEKQYIIDNGKYRLDFLLKNVLIVEYDEEQHKYSIEEDYERIMYCRDWLSENEGEKDGWKYPVIRVKKGEELEGLNRIVRHLAGFEMFDTQYNYKMEVCDYK